MKRIETGRLSAAGATSGAQPATERASEVVLTTADLVGIVIREGTSRRHASLSRALRWRAVSRAWASAVASHLATVRSVDLTGCRTAVLQLVPAGLSLGSITELLWDCSGSVTLPNLGVLRSVTSLALRSSPLSDAMLAATVASLDSGTRLRSLSLSHCVHASEASLSVLLGHGRTLTSLDLSGCRSALRLPLHLERLFQACAPRLKHLDLSGTEVSCAILGSVLITCTQLTSLLLDGTGLDGERLCPSVVLSAHHGERPSSQWKRLARLQTLSVSDNPQNTASAMTQIVSSVPSLTNLNLGGLEVWPSELEPLLHALTTAPALRQLGCHDCEAGPDPRTTAWLSVDVLRRLQRSGLCVALDPQRLRSIGSARHHVSGTVETCMHPSRRACMHHVSGTVETPTSRHASMHAVAELTEKVAELAISVDLAPESWEDLDDGVASLTLPTAPPPPPLLAALPSSCLIDYSRPPAYRYRTRSIYHVSQGSQPYYGTGDGSSGRGSGSSIAVGGSGSGSGSAAWYEQRQIQTDRFGLRI